MHQGKTRALSFAGIRYRTAAKHRVAIVKDRCLTGGYGTLRLIEADRRSVVSFRLDGCILFLVKVSYLDSCAKTFRRSVESDPVDIAGFEP
jgi:hypothetical protein